MTDWRVLAAITAGFVTWFILKRVSWISARSAQSFLSAGASVVDVRTEAEFRAGHLPGALNMPLDNLAELAPRGISDKQSVVLLHCLSGARSAFAQRQLKSLGYMNVFNLGSYGRAERIVRATKPPALEPLSGGDYRGKTASPAPNRKIP